MLPHWLRSLFSPSTHTPTSSASSVDPPALSSLPSASSATPSPPAKSSKLSAPLSSGSSVPVEAQDSLRSSAADSSVNSVEPPKEQKPLVYFGGAAADLMKPPPPPPQEVYFVVFLQGLVCAPAIQHEDLTIYPLLRHEAPASDVLFLQEAILQNKAAIEEISAIGHPTKLAVHNHSKQPLLILNDEIFSSLKQARISNASYLLAPQSRHIIEVSPIEQELRKQTSPIERLARTELGLFAALGRAHKLHSVSRSFRREQTFASDLHNLRRDTERYLAHSQALSISHSYLDAQEAHHPTLEHYLKALPYQEHQVGQIAYLHGHLLALDLLDSPSTAAFYYPHWIASYVQDIHVAPPTAPSKGPHGEALLEALWQFTAEARPSLSMGLDLRLQNAGLIGAGLSYEQRLLHLCLFPAKTKD